MTTLSLELSRRWPSDRALALAASVIAHLVFMALLLAHLGSTLPRDEAPSMKVTLVESWPRPQPRSVPASRPRAQTTTAPTWPVETRPEPALARPSAALTTPATVTAPNLSAALRGRLGCDHAALVDLTPSERQGCQDRFGTSAAAGAARPLDLSRGGSIVERSREPFLARTPHNGCVPNLDQKERPLFGVARSDWSAGVKCAWSF